MDGHQKKQGIHDKLAGTVVVKTRPVNGWLIAILCTPIFLYIGFMIFSIVFMSVGTFSGHMKKAQDAKMIVSIRNLDLIIRTENADNWDGQTRFLGDASVYKKILSDNEISTINWPSCVFVAGSGGTTPNPDDNKFVLITKRFSDNGISVEGNLQGIESVTNSFSCDDFSQLKAKFKELAPSDLYKFVKIDKNGVIDL